MEKENIVAEKLKTYIQITRITIAICWIALFAFWAIKLFGGNFFEIVVQNENFIKFSQKVETTWLKYLVSFIPTFIYNYITLCAVCQKFTFKGKELIFSIISVISMWVVSNFVNIDIMKMWYGYFVIIIFTLFVQKGFRKIYGLLGAVLDLLFSVISLMTRNVPLIVTQNYLISFVLIIDMYLMLILYYLYMNLKYLLRRK